MSDLSYVDYSRLSLNVWPMWVSQKDSGVPPIMCGLVRSTLRSKPAKQQIVGVPNDTHGPSLDTQLHKTTHSKIAMLDNVAMYKAPPLDR